MSRKRLPQCPHPQDGRTVPPPGLAPLLWEMSELLLAKPPRAALGPCSVNVVRPLLYLLASTGGAVLGTESRVRALLTEGSTDAGKDEATSLRVGGRISP